MLLLFASVTMAQAFLYTYVGIHHEDLPALQACISNLYARRTAVAMPTPTPSRSSMDDSFFNLLVHEQFEHAPVVLTYFENNPCIDLAAEDYDISYEYELDFTCVTLLADSSHAEEHSKCTRKGSSNTPSGLAPCGLFPAAVLWPASARQCPIQCKIKRQGNHDAPFLIDSVERKL